MKTFTGADLEVLDLSETAWGGENNGEPDTHVYLVEKDGEETWYEEGGVNTSN